MSIAMVFPGQGSQSVGMQNDLAKLFPIVEQTYAEASEVLGYDLWDVVLTGPAERLDETTVTQPAMLTAGVAACRIWTEKLGPEPSAMAGHSLGEYTALVCAGAIDFSDAVSLVQHRAQLMHDAIPHGVGAMAAIIGLDDDAVRKLCDESSDVGVAEAVNFNSPGQVVIAGHKESVLRAIERAEEVGARRAIMLHVSVPSHSSVMVGAGTLLEKRLAKTNFSPPAITVFNATTAEPYSTVESIREHLSRQVHSPVQWVDTIRAMVTIGVDRIVECGPGRVLAGLTRRISRDISVGSIDSPTGLEKALDI